MDPGVVAHPSVSAWALLHLSYLWGHAGSARHGQFSDKTHVHTVKQFFAILLMILCRGGFQFKLNSNDKDLPRHPRPYPREDFYVLVIKEDGTVDMGAWATFCGYETNRVRHLFRESHTATPVAPFLTFGYGPRPQIALCGSSHS